MVNPNPRPGAVAVENWDEAKIEQAVKELKDLHIQLRHLRSTIPRMHQNLGGPVASAEQMVTAVRGATQGALDEVDQYKKKATSPETTKILERAKQSRQQNPKGITPWRPKNDPDWLNPEPER